MDSTFPFPDLPPTLAQIQVLRQVNLNEVPAGQEPPPERRALGGESQYRFGLRFSGFFYQIWEKIN